MADQGGGAPEGKVAIVTIHGTNDTAKDGKLEGEKWFQKGSTFSNALLAALTARGVSAEIEPFLWSGANSGREREAAADRLTNRINRYRRQYPQVHLIGHSHGGNVANEAADFLRWGRNKKPEKEPIKSLITVGTPFFKRSSSQAELLGGLLFMGVTVLSGLMVIALTLGIIFMLVGGELHPAGQTSDDTVWTNITLGIGVVALIGMFIMGRLAIAGVRRLLRPQNTKNAQSLIQAIWHPNDEAISFLQKLEQAPIAPLGKWAIWRGSRTQAIVWGVRAVLILGLMAILSLLQIHGGLPIPNIYGPVEADATVPGVPEAMFFTSLATPLIFLGVYGLYRVFFGFLPEIFLRNGFNRAFAGALKGMAFGKDGDVDLSQVATASHTHPTDQIVLKGPVATRMQTVAGGAAAKLIEKYRWSLFTIGSDSNAAMQDIAADAETWDSLIHTIYFDQPEVVELIADRIAASVKGTTPVGG